MSNLPLSAEFDSNAQFNEKSYSLPDNCPESNCDGIMEYHDSGSFKNIDWLAVKCSVCCHIESTEPDIN